MSRRIEQGLNSYSFEEKTLPELPEYRGLDSKKSIRFKDWNVRQDESAGSRSVDTSPSRLEKQFSWKSITTRATSWRRTEEKAREPVEYWKPKTLRAHILVPFVALSVGFIIILEMLSWKAGVSSNILGSGALVYAQADGTIPAIFQFAYLYFPTILAVLYSIVWSGVDLDAKRLEPWFQLSRANGSTAQNSLLLQYTFEFLAFVPFTAWRLRHWAVFYAGTTMMITSWIVTPFQSAIFTTSSVNRVETVGIVTSADLLNVSSQSEALNANFLNTAYAVSWLGQKLPAFATPEVAVLPFIPTGQIDNGVSGGTWSTATTAFRTNITCTPAKVTAQKNFQYTFDNGDGCIVPDIGLPDATNLNASYLLLYIGYYNSPVLDWALQNPNCTEDQSHNFLAIWGSALSQTSVGVYSNMTALFCQPNYYTEDVNVIVDSSNGAILSTEYGSEADRTTLSEDVFNRTNFEQIIGIGIPADSVRQDFQDGAILEQFPRIQDYNITWPVTSMVGFAVSENPATSEDLFHFDALVTAFTRAHELVFSMAISTLLVPLDSPSLDTLRSGIQQDERNAIILVRVFSLVVEIALFIVAVMCLILLYISTKRPSRMTADPASLTAIMTSVCGRSDILEDFLDTGSLDSRLLEQRISTRRFRLVSEVIDGVGTMRLQSMSSPSYREQENMKRGAENLELIKPDMAVRPIELSLYAGFALVGSVLGAIIIVVFLYLWILRNGGIERPTSNSAVLSILENFVPTAFATLLEPFWVVLNRFLCLLSPFDELRRGKADSSKSLDVRYTSLPPQLVAWRAVKAQHYVLAVTCLIALSTNILAVSLSGLFTEDSTTGPIPISTTNTLSAVFSENPITGFAPSVPPIVFQDHFYVALSNLTQGTSLPPWIDSHHFYLPFEQPPLLESNRLRNGGLKVQSYQATTRGFGASIECLPLLSPGSDNSVLFESNENGGSIQFMTTHRFTNDTKKSCVTHVGDHFSNETTVNPGSYGQNASALEVMKTMTTPASASTSPFCESIVVAGWVRLGAALPNPPSNSSIGTNGRPLTSSFIGCLPKLHTAEFKVTVDLSGRILQSEQMTPFATDITPFLSSNASTSLFQQSSALIAAFSATDFAWHSDSFTSDWLNALLKATLNSSSLVDPSSPIPDSTTIAPITASLYTQLFAILLGLNPHLFLPPVDPSPIAGTIIASETRIFMSPILFQLTTALLAIHLCAAILYYARRPPKFLPRLPTTIASVVAYVAGSRALRDFEDDSKKKEARFGFGRFVGTDGRSRVGIEKEPWVVRMESKNPEVGRTWSLRWRKDGKAPKSWI